MFNVSDAAGLADVTWPSSPGFRGFGWGRNLPGIAGLDGGTAPQAELARLTGPLRMAKRFR